MSISLEKHDVQIDVVKQQSHVDSSLINVFACAIEGGSYYFTSINLVATRGNEIPTIILDRSAGSLCVERDGSLLWSSGRIIDRGGGMGNENKLYFTSIPEGFIYPYEYDVSMAVGETDALSVGSFNLGDIVLLRSLQNTSSSFADTINNGLAILKSLKTEWDNQKRTIDYLLDRSSAEEEVKEIQELIDDGTFKKTGFNNSNDLNGEKVYSRNKEEARKLQDQFCFKPSGMK